MSQQVEKVDTLVNKLLFRIGDYKIIAIPNELNNYVIERFRCHEKSNIISCKSDQIDSLLCTSIKNDNKIYTYYKFLDTSSYADCYQINENDIPKDYEINYCLMFLYKEDQYTPEQLGCNIYYNKKIAEGSNVISTSIFRPKQVIGGVKGKNIYINGMVNSAIDLPNKLPNWIYRIYLDYSFFEYNNIYEEFIEKLLEIIDLEHVQIVVVTCTDYLDEEGPFYHHGLFITNVRFLAIHDKNINHVVIRNVSTPILCKEVININKWIESDKNYMFYYDVGYNFKYSGMGQKANITLYLLKCLNERLNNDEFKEFYETIDNLTNMRFLMQNKDFDFNTHVENNSKVWRVLAGLWGAKGGQNISVWTDILRFLKDIKNITNENGKCKLDIAGGYKYGIDELALTFSLFKNNILGTIENENESSYLIKIKTPNFRREPFTSLVNGKILSFKHSDSYLKVIKSIKEKIDELEEGDEKENIKEEFKEEMLKLSLEELYYYQQGNYYQEKIDPTCDILNSL